MSIVGLTSRTRQTAYLAALLAGDSTGGVQAGRALLQGLESAVSFRARPRPWAWPDDRLAFVEVDRAAPVVAESSIEVAAEPEVVWDTIADFGRWPVWNPDVRSVSFDGPVAEGTTFPMEGRPGDDHLDTQVR
jgi:Polyketide cyclase / dehydrase and lipid transport